MRSPSGRFSVNRFYNELRSQGLSVGKDALHAWLEHLQDAFLVFAVERHARSVKQRQSNPKKAYLIDHGLARAVQFGTAGDIGHLLENAVYLEARRRGQAAAYVVTDSGAEVDFLLQRRDGERELVQVCADLSQPSTRERELNALLEAMRELRLETGTIVTLREEETLRPDGRAIRVVPAWRWLLEERAGGERANRRRSRRK